MSFPTESCGQNKLWLKRKRQKGGKNCQSLLVKFADIGQHVLEGGIVHQDVDAA